MNVSSGQEPKAERTTLKNGPSPRYGFERRSLLSKGEIEAHHHGNPS